MKDSTGAGGLVRYNAAFEAKKSLEEGSFDQLIARQGVQECIFQKGIVAVERST